jgi:prepilin-type N-terminal cleavage/methylation domain-containing protein
MMPSEKLLAWKTAHQLALDIYRLTERWPKAKLYSVTDPRSSAGFTLIEVLISIVVLGVGVLALTGTSATVNRMIGRGRVETHAALLASRRVEQLRIAAASTSPRCAAAAFTGGGPIWQDGLRQSWTVDPVGNVRRVRVTVSYLTIRGPRSAVLETSIQC